MSATKAILDTRTIVIDFLDYDDNAILAVCRAFSHDHMLLSALMKKERFTFRYVHPAFRQDKSIVREAILAFSGISQDFERLWRSVYFQDDVDLLSFSCAKLQTFAYKLVPDRIRENVAFVMGIVQYADDASSMARWCDDDGGSATWIPDILLEADRDFALHCAEKGVSPFGTESDLWIDDIVIVEAYMLSVDTTLIPCAVCEALLDRRRDFMHDFADRYPYRAAENFFPYMTKFDDVEGFLRRHFSDDIKASQLDGNLFHENVWPFVWRRIVRCNTLTVVQVDPRCINETDKGWIGDIFRRHPALFRRSRLQNAEWLADIVLPISGVQICKTRWVQHKRLALLAVRQDGRALKFLCERLRYDHNIVLAAVLQTWAALAWVPETYLLLQRNGSTLIKLAVSQNAAAAQLLSPAVLERYNIVV